MHRFSASPAKPQTRIDYHRRVERVIDLIRKSPEHPFTVRELARHAAFSEFHFHRVFRAMAGESVAQCIQRHRLEKAAGALVYGPDAPVTTIALESGFSSSANFSKAFRKAYGCTPTQYRRKHPPGFRLRRIGKAKRPESAYPYGMSVDVEILTMPERTLASLRLIGPYGHAAISQLYADLGDWYQTQFGCSAPQDSISITWSDASLAEQETMRMDGCFVVPETTTGSGRVAIRTLSGGRTACLRASLSQSEMHRISGLWGWLLSIWLPRSCVALADHPSYEVYRAWDKGSGFDITLCLPLTDLDAEYDYD